MTNLKNQQRLDTHLTRYVLMLKMVI